MIRTIWTCYGKLENAYDSFRCFKKKYKIFGIALVESIIYDLWFYRFDLCGKIKELVKPFDIDVPTISVRHYI